MLLLPSKSDKKYFDKLGITSVDGLLLYAPVRFEDRTLKHTLLDSPQVLDATVESVDFNFRRMSVQLYCHNLDVMLSAVFFKPKPYMKNAYAVGNRDYFFGKIEHNFGKYQVVHPKKIGNIGEVIPQYASELRTDTLMRLIKTYLTTEYFEQLSLPPEVKYTLQQVHFPNQSITSLNDEALYALKFAELYFYLRKLKNSKVNYPPRITVTPHYNEWMASLPFTLTDDQKKALKAIEADFNSPFAARRIVVGDVGCGKTMVMLAAVVMASPHRSIIMAPTTILANQLFEEAQKYLEMHDIVLVTNTTKKVNLELFNCIIGTHALLYRELPESALIVIDEQHRFGTNQRTMLEKLVSEGDKRPHFLQFTATPIPRTQALIDSAMVDVTLIEQTPFKKEIATQLLFKKDFKKLLGHIESELAQNYQVLLVYPLVEQSESMNYQSIEEAKEYWQKHYEKVYYTHGKDKDKEAILMEFRENGNILLATTVIEVGISLPRLSTVVIVGAERLGLATLHQLRGRVARTGIKGYCYLFTYAKESERLSEFCTTTNGFDIAALDLKYRNSGDLLSGKQQSGKSFRWFDLASDNNIVNDVKSWMSSSKY